MKTLSFLMILLVSFNSYGQSLLFPSYGEYIEFDEKIFEDGQSMPEGEVFTSVTRMFGTLKVKEGKIEGESLKKPWSSYWFPYFETFMFEAQDSIPAPLQKYDEFMKRNYRFKVSTADFEKNHVYNNRASDWEGLCHAWALASIVYPEPKREVTLRGITFRVADLKALLLKTFEEAPLGEFFGQRNNAEWDSVYADVYPEQFHKFVQEVLIKQKKSFIMDYDAGNQVWNVPVFKAISRVQKSENDPKRVKVKTYIYYADPFVNDKNFVGTEEVIKSYNYDLIGNWIQDEFVVDYGVWTESSKWDHPDYMIFPPEKIERKSRNELLNYKVVDEILKHAI